MVDDTRHRGDPGPEHLERTPGQELVAAIERKSEAYKPAIAAAVGPLLSMADIVAFYGSCCDLMTAGWVELYESSQAVADPEEAKKTKLRIEILRGLCTSELQRLFNIMGSADPRKAAGL